MSEATTGRHRSRHLHLRLRQRQHQRLREIVRMLRSGVTRVEDLTVAVDVSESTVRRDLASLEAEPPTAGAGQTASHQGIHRFGHVMHG